MKPRIGKIAVFLAAVAAIFSILFYAINFDFKKKDVERQQVEMEKIDSAISEKLGTMNFGMEKYSVWATKYALALTSNSLDADPDGDGLPNYLEYAYGTDPSKSDTDGDTFSDKQELINGYDPNDDGKARLKVQIKIEKLGVEVPMLWSNTIKDSEILKDLEKGVSHYYKTASPGQVGNMVVSGHSSNYAWAKGDYNSVFKDLDTLEIGDVVTVNTYQVNGRMVTYKYVVSNKFVTTADDQQVFVQPETPVLTLSTCWPIGTNLKRLIVQARIEK